MLNLLLDYGLLLPGVQFETNYLGMDLPNLMEKFRVDYAAEVGKGSRMWKVEGLRHEFVEHRERIQERRMGHLRSGSGKEPQSSSAYSSGIWSDPHYAIYAEEGADGAACDGGARIRKVDAVP
jgi:hypothetical protein